MTIINYDDFRFLFLVAVLTDVGFVAAGPSDHDARVDVPFCPDFASVAFTAAAFIIAAFVVVDFLIVAPIAAGFGGVAFADEGFVVPAFARAACFVVKAGVLGAIGFDFFAPTFATSRSITFDGSAATGGFAPALTSAARHAIAAFDGWRRVTRR